MNPILKEEHMLHLKNISLFHKREKKEGKNEKEKSKKIHYYKCVDEQFIASDSNA